MDSSVGCGERNARVGRTDSEYDGFLCLDLPTHICLLGALLVWLNRC